MIKVFYIQAQADCMAICIHAVYQYVKSASRPIISVTCADITFVKYTYTGVISIVLLYFQMMKSK